MPLSDQDEPSDGDGPDAIHEWRLRPKRLLFAIGLILTGVVWSIVAGSSVPAGKSTPSVVSHRPVETHVQVLDGMRVRPQLAPNMTLQQPAIVQVSFHNVGHVPRLISPQALHLIVSHSSIAPGGVGHDALHVALLLPDQFVSGSLHFAHTLAPGATLVFAPAWAHGHSVRWLLWS